MPDRRLRGVPNTSQLDVDHVPPRSRVGFLEHAVACDAGVRTHDVQSAKFRYPGVERRLICS
jgi:hypothetical protein